MEKSDKTPNFYEFGDFCLDCAERTLWRGEELIALPPKVFDTLCILVERQGKIVTKKEILDTVWADSFVEEGNLTQNIYTLRRMLGTDESGKNFIETVSKKGYRFVPNVRRITKNGQIIEPISSDKPTVINESKPEYKADSNNKKSSLYKYLIPIAASLLLISFLVYYFRSSGKQSPTDSIQNMEFQQKTFSGKADFPIISPAGDSLAYVSDGAIFIQETNSENAQRLNIPNETTFAFLQFSPDGKTINYRNNSTLFVSADVFQVSRFGGEKKKLAENVWSGFSFSPNGNFLAFVRIFPESATSSLIIKNLISSEERKLDLPKTTSEFVRNSYPAWSSDGTKIAISVSKQTIHNASSQLTVFDVSNGAIKELNLPQLKQFEQVVWLPEGKAIAAIARENKKFFQVWEVSYPDGKFRRITNDNNTYRNLSLSSDGKKMLTGLFSTSSNIWTAEKGNPEKEKQITSGNLSRDGVVGLSLTKNGEVIYSSRITGNIDLWKISLQNEQKQQLTKNSGEVNSQPIVSPDGKFIYFNSNRSGNVQIWRIDAESGENQTQLTFGEKETSLLPQISPDGNILYYLKKGEKKRSIWRKFLDSGKEEILLVEGNITPLIELSLSPDGNFLATCNISETEEEENDNQTVQIAIVSTIRIAPPMLFPATGCQIGWSQNSEAFDYTENLAKGTKIWRQTLTNDSKPELIMTTNDGKINHFAWTNDENTLVFAKGKQATDAILLTDFR